MTNPTTAACQTGCESPTGPPIAREAWLSHERFPAQTLLLGSHMSFRAVSQALIERAEHLPLDRASRSGLSSIQSTFNMWMGAMRNHEHYEERKLYPYLANRYDTSMACLVRQHHGLHGAESDVHMAFEEADPSLLSDALRAHARKLSSHLQEEEDVVIPMLLELSPDEFAAYVRLPG